VCPHRSHLYPSNLIFAVKVLITNNLIGNIRNAKIELKDGFTMQEGEYEYRTGTSRFGFWLSRRRMGLEGLRQLEDKPPQRLDLTPPPTSSAQLIDRNLIERLTAAIQELAYAINTQVISSLATDEDSRQRVLARVKNHKT
jgi:hypothetical protein